MFDETVSKVDEADLIFACVFGIVSGKGIDDGVRQTFVAFRLNGGGAIRERFLDVSYDSSCQQRSVSRILGSDEKRRKALLILRMR